MQSILTTMGTFLGGLGLFLLAMSMMSEGLKLAAGNALRGILARSTRTPRTSIASGALFTALVQSSSAVTIATIGFVNAGLLATYAALGIILGATLGTTVTGWLVAGVGLQFDIAAFALPMVGVGVLLRLLGPSRRVGAVGETLAGFGLFFIGVDFLRDAFDGLAASMDMARFDVAGATETLLFIGIGLVMTIVTQSSSAAVAIILSAVSGGVISFAAAGAAVIGAAVGTTSTSALAVIGATASAKRIAAGHVVINSFTALVGLALLPLLVTFVADSSRLQSVPALTLAAFHTSFTLLGVLLFRPLLAGLAHALEGLFRNPFEAQGKPEYLDANVLESPVLAMDAFLLELRRMARLAREHAHAAVSGESGNEHRFEQQAVALNRLMREVERYVSRLGTARLENSITSRISLVLRVANYIDEMVDYSAQSKREAEAVNNLLGSEMAEPIEAYREAVIAHLRRCDPELTATPVGELEAEYQSLREQWRSLKSRLLEAGVEHRLPLTDLNPVIDALRGMLRVAERASRIAVRLAELEQLAQTLPQRDGHEQQTESRAADPPDEAS